MDDRDGRLLDLSAGPFPGRPLAMLRSIRPDQAIGRGLQLPLTGNTPKKPNINLNRAEKRTLRINGHFEVIQKSCTFFELTQQFGIFIVKHLSGAEQHNFC